MIKNDYRRAFIMLRPAAAGYGGHARLERRTLTGSLYFIVTAPEGAGPLAAALVGRQGGDYYAAVLGEFTRDRRGQLTLAVPFDPRAIDGRPLEAYWWVAVADAASGATVLTEVPEMFGAETILMNRCRSREEFDKTVDLINDFKKYFMRYGEKVDENPSPGNKEGGITTLEDKSLGCTQKGGTAPVEDVLLYGEAVKKKGLSLLQAPGNDLVASNALAASGAQIILFTTGRGTPFGCPVPTAKISSNSVIANRKKSWIDFNAGSLLENKTMEELTDEFFDYVLALASGEVKAKAEMLDKHEIAIFKDGVTL